MPQIHPTAIIEKGATLADDVVIGAYCHIGGKVILGGGVELKSHVVVAGHTTVGDKTVIYPFASIGHAPQDLKFKGEASTLVIGSHTTIREHVTMNPGTEGGGMITRVGNHCLFMAGAHVAHDCIVGNHVILANNAALAGHVTVGDYAIVGGLSAVHQFARIGHHAMIGGMSGIVGDVMPYASAAGERANLIGLNLVGLKRRGVSREEITALRSAYKMMFFGEGMLEARLEKTLAQFGHVTAVKEILEFLRADSSRALCLPKAGTDDV